MGYDTIPQLAPVILALAVLVLFLFIAPIGPEKGRTAIPEEVKDKGAVSIVGVPAVESAHACDGEQCTYSVSVLGLNLRSRDDTKDILLTERYKRRERYFPCVYSGETVSSIPCTASKEGTLLDYHATYEGLIQGMPPTLNLTKFSRFRGLLYDDQRIIIGNYIVDISAFNRLAARIPLKNVDFIARCKDELSPETKGMDPGDNFTFHKCRGTLRVIYEDSGIPFIDDTIRGARYACVTIEASGGEGEDGKKWEGAGDPVELHLWGLPKGEDGEQVRAEDWNCGGVAGTPPASGLDFSLSKAREETRCFDNFLATVELNAPVSEFVPGASGGLGGQQNTDSLARCSFGLEAGDVST